MPRNKPPRTAAWLASKGASAESRYTGTWTHTHSRLNGVGTRLHHDGLLEKCSDRVCQQIAERHRSHPYGAFCVHGHQIIEPVPAPHTCDRPADDPPGCFSLFGGGSADCKGCYPETRVADPWPCRGCTLEEFEAEMRQAEEEYQESMWDEYRSAVGY